MPGGRRHCWPKLHLDSRKQKGFKDGIFGKLNFVGSSLKVITTNQEAIELPQGYIYLPKQSSRYTHRSTVE